MLHSTYDQPEPNPCVPSSTGVINALAAKLPAVAEHLDTAPAEILASTPFSRAI